MMMTDVYFNEMYNIINSMNMADPTTRALRRLILSNAYPVEVDKVGRVQLPQNLRQFLGVESGELIVAGQGDYFELWALADWQAQMEDIHDAQANEQRFATLNLSRNTV
jgi:MraZ protein